jgi:hypothetical protein
MAGKTGLNIIKDGLILELDAANNKSYVSGSLTWIDISKTQTSGSLVNGPIFNSGSLGNIIFDGTNDYADVALPSGLTTLTIEAFIKWNSSNGGMFLGFDLYDIWTSGGTLGYNSGASNVVGINAATVTSLGLIGNWKHYVFTMNSSGLLSTNKMHINGVQQSISAVVGGDGNNANFGTTLRLCSWTTTNGFFGNVTYGYVRGYNRALTNTEIFQNYNTVKTRFNL